MSVIKDIFRTTTSALAALRSNPDLFHGEEQKVRIDNGRRKVKKNRNGNPAVAKRQPFGHYINLTYLWKGWTHPSGVRSGLAKCSNWLHATKGPRVHHRMPTMWIVGRPWYAAGRQDLLPRPKSVRRRVPVGA